jgi:hypothetical protein
VAQTYPIRASFLSSVIGLVIVTTSFVIFLFVALTIGHWLNPYFVVSSYEPSLADAGPLYNPMRWLSAFITRMRPALIIHLWLPPFALSSLVVRLVFLSFRAVEWAQRFLKQGDAHPFRAIGVVATIIVFGSATLGKEAWTLLAALR